MLATSEKYSTNTVKIYKNSRKSRTNTCSHKGIKRKNPPEAVFFEDFRKPHTTQMNVTLTNNIAYFCKNASIFAEKALHTDIFFKKRYQNAPMFQGTPGTLAHKFPRAALGNLEVFIYRLIDIYSI